MKSAARKNAPVEAVEWEPVVVDPSQSLHPHPQAVVSASVEAAWMTTRTPGLMNEVEPA